MSDPELPRASFVDAEFFERLAHVRISLSGRHDADARTLARIEDAVERIVPSERLDGRQLEVEKARFLREAIVRPADVQAARRHREVVGDIDLDAIGIDRDRSRAIRHIRLDLQTDPAARIARQRPAVEPEIEHVLNVTRREHRNRMVHEVRIRTDWQGPMTSPRGRRPAPAARHRVSTNPRRSHA